MLKPSRFFGELDFLNQIHSRGSDIYRSAPWLKNEFTSDIWKIKFEHLTNIRTIDFRILMSDGYLLTDSHHSSLLWALKEWLCASTHPHATAARPIRSVTMQTRVNCTLHIIDYLLLNQDNLGLCKNGLSCVTENDLRVLFSRLANTKEVAESVYKWKHHLRQFLLKSISEITAKDIAEARHDLPMIDIDLDCSEDLQFAPSQVLAARVWIWQQGLYKVRRQGGLVYVPDVTEIASRIYINTLWGAQSREAPPELHLLQSRLAERERKAVPVRNTEDQFAVDRVIALYMRCLGNLRLIERNGHRIPASSIESILKNNPRSWLTIRDIGRFQTLPQDVVFTALKNAIEFSLEYGEVIVDTYNALAIQAGELSCSIAEVERKKGLRHLIPQKLHDIGVKRWRISRGTRDSGDYFVRLRKNEGLSELIMILIGSVFIITGATTARRNGELTDLAAGKCIDRNGRNLIFENRKSGASEVRQREQRPIPPIVARLVRLLERLHHPGKSTDKPKAERLLFSYPSRLTGNLTSNASVYFCVDLFCDYFEIQGNAPDTRHYIRQHQLRRFFAIAFFWGSGFGGLDTLRWFLGHTDPKHVWRYILESVPGKILTSVRSRYATQALLSGNPAADALADIVEQRFKTREFSVLDIDELEEYIETLLDDSRIQIEPQFFTGDSGENYRIAIFIKR